MSTYMYFYGRPFGSDNFVRLGEFSRNQAMFQYFGDIAPFEKIAPLSYKTISEVEEAVHNDLADYENNITENEKTISLIATFDNSVEAKAAYIETITRRNEDLRDDISELKDVEKILFGLFMVLQTANLYIGLEISDPTIEDIGM